MSVTRVTYATREEVKRAADIKYTAFMDAQVDRAIEAATDSVEGQLHRVFYPTILTRYWDWPNFQYAYPWRIWFDQWELADIPTSVTSGGTAIPLSACYFEPVNDGPPYTYLELRRDENYGFGVGPTPQRDVAITGPYGFWTKTVGAGALAAAMSDTTSTTMTVTNSAVVGVGDHVLVDSERLILTDQAMVDSGQAQIGSGCTSASLTDNLLTVTTGSSYAIGEVLRLDSERMLVLDISGNVLMVKRAWDGTGLATHSAAEIYAPRQFTVTRGALGTTPATHLSAAAVNVGVTPRLVKQLTVAEALVDLKQQTGAYAASQGTGPATLKGVGTGLPDLRSLVFTQYGRKARIRTV